MCQTTMLQLKIDIYIYMIYLSCRHEFSDVVINRGAHNFMLSADFRARRSKNAV